MFTLEAPPRNLFSRRVACPPTPLDAADYLASLRGSTPTWGDKGKFSPQKVVGDALVATRLADTLATRLRAKTGLRRLPAAVALDRVVEAYLADLALLGDQLDAVHWLFAEIADAQTVPWGTGPVDELAAKARASYAKTLFTAKRLAAPHLATAQLLATPAAARAAFEKHVDRRARTVANWTVDYLIRGLGEGGTLGLVAWPSRSTAWYVRHERVVERVKVWQNTYRHWHRVHEIHLMDAETLAGVPGWLDPPPAVARVIDAVPPLLHPELTTVVGTMVRQRRVEWVVGEATYPQDRVTPQRGLVLDPAVCIGGVVLTGWESPAHRQPGWWQRLDRYLARGAAVGGPADA